MLGHRASNRHTLSLELMERTLCKIFHNHGIRRLGCKSQLYFMAWGRVSPPQGLLRMFSFIQLNSEEIVLAARTQCR